MSQPNAKAFITLSAKTSANSTDTIEIPKGKSKSCPFCGFSHKFGENTAKEAKSKNL